MEEWTEYGVFVLVKSSADEKRNDDLEYRRPFKYDAHGEPGQA